MYLLRHSVIASMNCANIFKIILHVTCLVEADKAVAGCKVVVDFATFFKTNFITEKKKEQLIKCCVFEKELLS